MQELRRTGRIVLFDPERKPHEPYRRRLWLQAGLHQTVMSKGATSDEQRYYANVRALLKDFVIGGGFDDDMVFKPLRPPPKSLWEIRITFAPAARIFGGFVRKGEFLGTNMRHRKALERGFAPHTARSATIWKSMFGKRDRCPGGQEDRPYLLEDFDDYD